MGVDPGGGHGRVVRGGHVAPTGPPGGGLGVCLGLRRRLPLRVGWQVVAMNAVPCCLIALLGTRVVLRRWDANTFPALAKLTAGVAGGWLVLAWLTQAGFGHVGGLGLQLYAPDALYVDFYDDLRFYLGWSLGLSVVPNPVPEDGRGGP
jgi:hypothetical protein